MKNVMGAWVVCSLAAGEQERKADQSQAQGTPSGHTNKVSALFRQAGA